MIGGQLKCMGSIQHLKTRFGDGYTLTVKLKESPDSQPNTFLNLILSELKNKITSNCTLKERQFNNIFHFDLPYSDETNASQFRFDVGNVYRLVECNKLRFNILDYSLSQNSLDNLFIKFINKQTEADRQKYASDESNDIKRNISNFKARKNSLFPIHDDANDDELLILN